MPPSCPTTLELSWQTIPGETPAYMNFEGENFVHYRRILFHDFSSLVDSCIENPDTTEITAVIDGTNDGELPLCTEREISSRMLPDNLFHPGHIPIGPRLEHHDTIALCGSNHLPHIFIRNWGHSTSPDCVFTLRHVR